MNVRRQLRALALGAWMMMSMTSCGSVTLGGMNIRDSFTDEKVVTLVKAAVDGKAAQVAELASGGADVNAIGTRGVTPLLWTLKAKNAVGFEALLKAGADPNRVPPEFGYSAMWVVAGADDPQFLRIALRYGGNPNHPENGRISETPLFLAAGEGRMENVRMLLDAGANINAHDRFDATAANKATALGRFQVVAYLLERGFNHDLPGLAKRVGISHVPPNSEAQHWKDRVIEMLKARGGR